MNGMQKTLSSGQVREFYHDNFVADQVRDFLALLGDPPTPGALVSDVGGGCGYFARALQSRSGWRVRVLDIDPISVRTCHEDGIDAEVADAIAPPEYAGTRTVTFNLILHHLVGATDRNTRKLQIQALRAWNGRAESIFVNEYIYESSSACERAAAWLIFAITSNQALSLVGRIVSHFAPSLRANTFGIGVRFRAACDWNRLFEEAGLEVIAHRRGAEEPVSFGRRLLLIRNCRRDSFVLRRRVIGKGK
jgi:hypothetical protein